MEPNDADWYRNVLNSMRDMVLVKGPQSKLVWANKAFLQHYGMTAAELRDIVDAPHSNPDDTLQYVIDDQVVFDTEQHLDVPAESVTNSAGVPVQFNTIKSPIFEDGKMVLSVGVSRHREDDTIHRRDIGHEDAKRFTAPLRAFTSDFPLPMILLDLTGRIVNCSPLWKEHFGELVDSPSTFFQEIYSHLEGLNDAVEDTLEAKKRCELTLAVSRECGECFYDFHLSPWFFENGETGGVNIVASEITKLKTSEQTLRRVNDELAQFAYRASHDLKAPLSTSINLAKFIQQDIETGELTEASTNAETIIKGLGNLESLVSDILELARADLRGGGKEAIDIRAVLGDIQERHAQSIKDAEIELRVELDDVDTVVLGRARVVQIVENLLCNAIKYHNPERSPRFVDVSIATADSTLLITVADNGLGIPKKCQSEAFQMFKRFHPKVGDGSGLGLAIIKKHLDAMGGEIALESSSEGTRMEVSIPLNPSPVLHE